MKVVKTGNVSQTVSKNYFECKNDPRLASSVTRKKAPNVYSKLPKNDFTRKVIDFGTFTKLPKNVQDLGKVIVAKGFKKLPKVQ